MKKEYDLEKMKVKRRGALKDAKVQKTVRLDLDVLSWLIKEADRKGMPYQTLINATLKDAMNRVQPEVSETRVREIANQVLTERHEDLIKLGNMSKGLISKKRSKIAS